MRGHRWLLAGVALAFAGVPRAGGELRPWPTWNCPAVSRSCRPDHAAVDARAHVCDASGCELRVAVIMPNNRNYVVNAEEALKQLRAVEEHARQVALLPGRLNVTYRIFDDKCEQAHATIGTVDAYSQFFAHVIFGPICDYSLASTGRIVKFLGSHGTPLITAGGFSFDFVAEKTSCDKEFFMLINAGIADYQSFSEFFYLILARYKWRQIALMYEKYDQNEVGGDQSCQLLMKTVIGVVKNEIPDVNYHDGDIWLQKITYEEYLSKTVGTQFGIVVMCMSHANTRRVLLAAERLGMTERGEYVFLNFDMYNNGSQPWYDAHDSEANNERARKAYRSLLTFTPMIEAQNARPEAAPEPPGGAYLDGIYDGFLLYLHAIQRFLAADEDWSRLTLSGVDVVSSMYGRRFAGKRREEVVINCNGQRVASYALMQLGADGRLRMAANYTTRTKRMTLIEDIRWVGGAPPPDTPACGYDDSKCAVNVQLWIIVCIVALLLAVFAFGGRLYKKYRVELDLAADNWKIDSGELCAVQAARPSVPPARAGRPDAARGFEVAQYNMNDVIVKYFHPHTRIEVDRGRRVQLKKMRDISHPSLVKFYGACLEPQTTCVVTEYCQRGSLLDVLQDAGIVLDAVFQLSLIHDIVLGMHYLHSNDLTHGALKSTNCLIDAHFGVKLADFGLDFIRVHVKAGEDAEELCKKLIWTSPELLRLHDRSEKVEKLTPAFDLMKGGDVYSFGIIVHEIIVRKGPFYLRESLTAKEIVDRLKAPGRGGGDDPLRPHLDAADRENKLTDIMRECWAEDSEQRPDFGKLKTMIRELNRNNKGNLVDDLLNRMEQYANNLESLVMDRTNDFLSEKRKCEDLLYQLLPKSVASQLISGQAVIAETFNQVTICFSDIVDFTKLSAASTPLEVVDMLNDLYTCFDEVIGDFNVYKVETIGDAYLVVSGLPERNGQRHAAEIARMSLRLMETVRAFRIRHRPDDPLQLRIGMHSGPCVAGVVGLKMPRYCLFGDTVNTASRMESNGMPLRIHVSADTKSVLDAAAPARFQLECRGEIDIKGKGKMTTYWLITEVCPTPPPPPSPPLAVPTVSCTTGTAPISAKALDRNGASISTPWETSKVGNLKHLPEEGVPLLHMPVRPPV